MTVYDTIRAEAVASHADEPAKALVTALANVLEHEEQRGKVATRPIPETAYRAFCEAEGMDAELAKVFATLLYEAFRRGYDCRVDAQAAGVL